MNLWNMSALALALALGLVVGGAATTARADATEPHVSGALHDLQEAKRHLEALPRSDKRDHALDYTRDAIKAVEELQK
jgi:hypothetical protein